MLVGLRDPHEDHMIIWEILFTDMTISLHVFFTILV